MTTSAATDTTTVAAPASSAASEPPRPLVVLAGFLGAGKTHFLRGLIPALVRRGLRPRVILNDIESAKVDAATLRDLQVELTPVSGSCLCCETQEELVAALSQSDAAASPHDVVVLEANGTTDTALLLETLAEAPGLRHLCSPLQLTTVDALMFGRRGWMNGIEREQLMTSSHVRLGKADLVEPPRIEQLRIMLGELAPRAIFTDVEAFADDVADLSMTLRSSIVPDSREAIAIPSYPQGRAASAAAFFPPEDSFVAHKIHSQHRHPCLSCQIPMPFAVHAEAFEAFLRTLPETIVRAKGIVRIQDPLGAKRSFQMAAGIAEVSPCALQDPDDLDPIAIFVGSGIDETKLRELLARQANPPCEPSCEPCCHADASRPGAGANPSVAKTP